MNVIGANRSRAARASLAALVQVLACGGPARAPDTRDAASATDTAPVAPPDAALASAADTSTAPSRPNARPADALPADTTPAPRDAALDGGAPAAVAVCDAARAHMGSGTQNGETVTAEMLRAQRWSAAGHDDWVELTVLDPAAIAGATFHWEASPVPGEATVASFNLCVTANDAELARVTRVRFARSGRVRFRVQFMGTGGPVSHEIVVYLLVSA